MEHYVMCIWNRSLSEEDYALVINYFITVFPNAFQHHYIEHFAEEIAVLLKPVSKYIVVLNASGVNENVEWMCVNKDLNIKDILSKEIKNDCRNEFPSNDEIDQISASLHSLADQLPAFGTYRLDILLGSDILRNLSVSKEPVLAGIFIRLTRWHSARFTIFEQSEYDPDNLNQWCEIINSDILKKHGKLDLCPPLWRGAIIANTTDKVYEGFELKLDIENIPHIFHSSKDTKDEHSDHIVLSPKLQIINEVSFATIPPYLISPVIFRLQLGRLNVLNEKSFRFIDYLLCNKEAALIVRLEYAEINTKIKPEKKYCTSRWQKAISSHNLRDPQCFVSTFDRYFTLAVARSKSSDHITAYLLQKTNLDANFYFSIVNQRVHSLLCQIPIKKSVEIKESISNEVPLISGDLFHKSISKYMNQKMCYLKNGSLPTNVDNNSDFSSLMKDIVNFTISSSFGTQHSSNLLLEEIDPSDWPERIQLLHKQMQIEADECAPATGLLGQSLKLPQQSFSLSSDFITQYFLPSGESKNSADTESVYQLNPSHLITYDFNRVLNLNWPEVTNCTFHDLYYNSNCQTEDKESLGSQMVKLYVQHETASTCNNQQIIQNFSIIVSEKSSTPNKEFRSPSCRATNVNRKVVEKKDISPKQNFLKDLITKKILSSRTLYSENSSNEKNRSFTNPKRKRNLNESLVPVRCSPRKKKPVDYKYPPVNRNIKNSKSVKNHDSSKMTDLLRKKMRHAVATALEKNGINITHSSFKPCGSKLFSICKTFLDDLTLKKGKTSEYLQKIADAHVKQVIEFYQE